MDTPSDTTPAPQAPEWSQAPDGWDWSAQDADGRWYWYRTEPVPGIGGGIWRSNSRNQQFAAAGRPNPDWLESLRRRPGAAQAPGPGGPPPPADPDTPPRP
ncbi:hypothetical protein [Castellaniella defragrans]|jgi:hypothetical protein|uniref:Uncharacterized protein n=1 Tax=Castellaniella defragrans TaxID=75697 RepID=A0A7W9TQT9_CASDE|nr:hypothetical protein [Castellaniella defragrans]MBB6084881.1 hypothetical protein [Castellaniella defragrans]